VKPEIGTHLPQFGCGDAARDADKETSDNLTTTVTASPEAGLIKPAAERGRKPEAIQPNRWQKLGRQSVLFASPPQMGFYLIEEMSTAPGPLSATFPDDPLANPLASASLKRQ